MIRRVHIFFVIIAICFFFSSAETPGDYAKKRTEDFKKLIRQTEAGSPRSFRTCGLAFPTDSFASLPGYHLQNKTDIPLFNWGMKRSCFFVHEVSKMALHIDFMVAATASNDPREMIFHQIVESTLPLSAIAKLYSPLSSPSVGEYAYGAEASNGGFYRGFAFSRSSIGVIITATDPSLNLLPFAKEIDIAAQSPCPQQQTEELSSSQKNGPMDISIPDSLDGDREVVNTEPTPQKDAVPQKMRVAVVSSHISVKVLHFDNGRIVLRPKDDNDGCEIGTVRYDSQTLASSWQVKKIKVRKSNR
jgi:hypothetical protein